MSHKTFICSICGKEITKPKSSTLTDGTRACKIHSEIIGKRIIDTDIIKKQEQEKVKIEKENKNKIREYYRKQLYNDIANKIHRCWLCEKVIINAGLFYERLAINMKKSEIHPASNEKFPNIFDFNSDFYKKTRKELNEDGTKVLGRTFSNLNLPEYKIMMIKDPSKREVIRIMKVGCFCIECCEKLNIEFMPKINLSLENMAILGTFLDPIITDIAKSEIEKDN